MSDRSEWWDLILLIPTIAQFLVAIGILLLVKPFTLALLAVTVLFAVIAGIIYNRMGRMRGGEMAVGILLFAPAYAIAAIALIVFLVISIAGVILAL